MARPALASDTVPRRSAARGRWLRVARLAVTGLLVGAATGFLAALLRPRAWVEYVEPQAASRT
jgi:hypothetical protein